MKKIESKFLFEIVNDTGVEYMLIVATDEERAIKYANKLSELVEPEYEIGNINKSIEIKANHKMGLFTRLFSGAGEFGYIT